MLLKIVVILLNENRHLQQMFISAPVGRLNRLISFHFFIVLNWHFLHSSHDFSVLCCSGIWSMGNHNFDFIVTSKKWTFSQLIFEQFELGYHLSRGFHE